MSLHPFFEQALGIALPVIQAPMAGLQDAAMAIAVSEAGGLGSLPSARFDAQGLAAQLERLQHGTSKPYNLNFFCHQAPAATPEQEALWLQTLSPYFETWGVDASAIRLAAARQPFNLELAEVAAPFRPAVVSFHFGLPEPRLLNYVKSWGSLVISSATTVEEALWLQAQGVDAVIAQGLEAGGHRGHFLSEDLTRQMGTFALVPQLVKVLDVQVIAAGGIAGRHAARAALALGAAGVQAGTAYLLADEALTSPLHRAALKSDAARHTALTRALTGRPARGIVTPFMAQMQEKQALAPQFPLAGTALDALKAKAEQAGQTDFTALWSGQNNMDLLEQPAADITVYLGAGLDDD